MAEINSYLCMKYGKTPAADINGNNTTGDQLQASPLIKEGDLIASDLTTIVWNYTNNKIYHNDLITLGTDEKMNLGQKVSKSENTDNIVTLSTSNDFTSLNTNASRVDLPDLTYLVVGNNDSASAFTSTGAPINYTVLKRQWKAQVTEHPVPFTYSLIWIMPILMYLPNPRYRIVIDANADGSLADETPVLLTNTSGSLWSANVSIPNNALFTIAAPVVLSPGGVTGTSLWLKADAGVTTGATLTWADQSGNNINATQSTAAAQPVYNTASGLVNFNPMLSFNGTTHFMNIASNNISNSNTPYSFRFVGKRKGTGNMVTVAGGTYATNSAFTLYFETTGRFGDTWSSTANILSPNNAFPANSFAIMGTDYNLAKKDLYLNSKIVNTGSFTGHASTSGIVLLGKYVNAAAPAFLNADVAEVIAYSASVSPGDLQKIDSYLALKYGITLDPSVTNYVNSAATNIYTIDATYKNQIIGIGRDSVSAFYKNNRIQQMIQ